MFLQNTQKPKREITLNLTSCSCKKDNCGLTTILTNGCHIIYNVMPHTIDTVPRYRVANSSCLSRCSRLSLRRRSNSSSPFIAFTPAALC